MSASAAETSTSAADHTGALPPVVTPLSESTASLITPSEVPSTTTPPTPPTPLTPLPPAPEEEPGAKALFSSSLVLQRLQAADRRLPINIGHRGFRARFPENTMAAFVGALDEGGAKALETDVHLTRDGVVVLSHDPTLRRCFGRTERLADCDWAFLEPLRTVPEPGQPLARLTDLLAMLAEPGREDVWVLLDIKHDDQPETLVRRTAETLTATPGDWSRRIVLGCWDAHYMRLCRDLLPAFPRAYIGISLAYADALLHGGGDCVQVFNLLQAILVGARGDRFLAAARRAGKPVLVWTVNAPEWMAWSIRHELEGVISDDPAAFRDVCKKWEDGDKDGNDGKDGKDGSKSEPAKETTALIPASALSRPTPHPAASTSFTGLYVRRWSRLYGWVGFVRLLEFVFNTVMWLRRGSARARIQKAWTA